MLTLVSQAAEEIEHQAERANAIVEKVRDYVRSRTDKKATTDWRECLHHALHDFKVTQSYGGAIELNAPTSVWVTTDALELELIAINLMRNAAEAQTHVRQPIIRLSLTQSLVAILYSRCACSTVISLERILPRI